MQRRFFPFRFLSFLAGRFQKLDAARDIYVLVMVTSAAALNALLWYYLRASIDPHASFVTLHFTLASGVDLIGEVSEIYNIPFYAALFSLVNIIAAKIVYRYDRLLAYCLVSALPVLGVITFFNGFLLVSVNNQ